MCQNIYVDMIADLFHPGHINLFRQIKSLYPNCYIYVGLMSDEEAKEYKRLPILNIYERFTMVSSCKYVNKTFLNAPMPITEQFIDDNKIDLVIHGDDITEESKNYWYKNAINRGIYKEIPYTKDISTSDIIDRIRSRI